LLLVRSPSHRRPSGSHHEDHDRTDDPQPRTHEDHDRTDITVAPTTIAIAPTSIDNQSPTMIEIAAPPRHSLLVRVVLARITLVDSLEHVKNGKGSFSPEIGYSWYAGI
jgi:hypothetical protein